MSFLRDLPDLKLRIIGKGPEEQALRSLATQLGLSSVEFAGTVPDLSREYLDALGALFLSRDEDYGIVPVEAMAHGCPVIGVREGGVAETILDGETGLFTAPEPEAVATKMRFLYDNREQARAMGAAGRRRAADFSWDRHAAEIEGVLTSLHKGRPAILPDQSR